MSLRLLRWEPAHADRIRAMVAQPSLQPEFELALGPGLDRMLGDPFNRPELRRLAVLDGEDAGFAFAFVVPTAGPPFVAIRLGVREQARRRGVGSELLRAVMGAARESAPEALEFISNTVEPNPAADGFAAHHDFAVVRHYWTMERPRDGLAAPEWPAGVAIEPFVPTDAGIRRWVEVFNRSWKEHDHAVLATVEDVRGLIEGGTVDPATAFLAVRDGEAIGFVRGALHATRGEIAVLGVVPECRRSGLGTALLRFGCRWLVDHGAGRLTLLVDGQNERALGLYRREGFGVVQTRRMWQRRVG